MNGSFVCDFFIEFFVGGDEIVFVEVEDVFVEVFFGFGILEVVGVGVYFVVEDYFVFCVFFEFQFEVNQDYFFFCEVFFQDIVYLKGNFFYFFKFVFIYIQDFGVVLVYYGVFKVIVFVIKFYYWFWEFSVFFKWEVFFQIFSNDVLYYNFKGIYFQFFDYEFVVFGNFNEVCFYVVCFKNFEKMGVYLGVELVFFFELGFFFVIKSGCIVFEFYNDFIVIERDYFFGFFFVDVYVNYYFYVKILFFLRIFLLLEC